MTARMEQLMLAAADSLDNGVSPFEHAFLVEHDVSLDEAYTLAETLALAARVWVRTPAPTRARHGVEAAVNAIVAQIGPARP